MWHANSCAFSPLGFRDQSFYRFTCPWEIITSCSVSLAIFSSLAWTQHICVPTHVCSLLSCVRLFATLWTVAHQVPLSMVVLSRKEYHSFPQGIFLTQGLNSDPLICKQGSTEALSSPEKNLNRLQTIHFIIIAKKGMKWKWWGRVNCSHNKWGMQNFIQKVL